MPSRRYIRLPMWLVRAEDVLSNTGTKKVRSKSQFYNIENKIDDVVLR
jgi:hypothetical protein